MDADVICANMTDADDCDLYFYPSLPDYDITHFKLDPTDDPKKTNYVEGEPLSVFKLYSTVHIAPHKTLKLSRLSQQYTYTYCDPQGSSCQTEKFRVKYNHYQSSRALNPQSNNYIFAPTKITRSSPLPYNAPLHKTVFCGNLVTVVQVQGSLVDSQLRFYNTEQQQFDSVVELESFVKSIPVYEDKIGKEVVVDLHFDGIDNGRTFFTDSNGLELQERVLNFRPTWELQATEHASANYYPVNGMIQIKDKNSRKRVSVLNDRAQGGTSLNKGEVELMIHRRLLNFDFETMTETNPWNPDQGLWVAPSIPLCLRLFLPLQLSLSPLPALRFLHETGPGFCGCH